MCNVHGTAQNAMAWHGMAYVCVCLRVSARIKLPEWQPGHRDLSPA